MAQFRGILAEVDANLSEEDLDGIIAEIDEDGSGTMDFDEFCEMIMTKPEDQRDKESKHYIPSQAQNNNVTNELLFAALSL